MSLAQYAENLQYNGIEGIEFHIASVRRKNEHESDSPGLSLSGHTSGPKRELGPPVGHPPESLRPYINMARGSIHHVIDLDAESAMPTRLLRLKEEVVELVTSETTGYVEYVCLSHRWGPNETMKTTQESLKSVTSGVLISHLPTTFRDAVNFTKGLGYEYIWIDSLCIVQDDRHDWEAEAPRMACVYGNCACTISALDATDSDGGLFVPDCNDPGSLDKRGWVLQESMISPRSLLFTRGSMSWECRCSDAEMGDGNTELGLRHQRFVSSRPDNQSEFDTDVPLHPKEMYGFFRDFRLPNIEIDYPEGPTVVLLDDIVTLVTPKDYDAFIRAWWAFLPMYTTLQLTKPSDKLLAISGIVNTVQRSIHLRSYQGLWAVNHGLNELSWYVNTEGPEGDDGLGSHDQTLLQPMAPSWTWASLTSGKICNDLPFRETAWFECKPWIRLPTETSFEHSLPYASWRWLTSICIEIKATWRNVTITRKQAETEGRVDFDVELDWPYSHTPDNEHCDFRPDVLANFPPGQPLELTCAHLLHYDKDALVKKGHTGRKEHIDVYVVLQKLLVRDNEQGNTTPSETVGTVGFDFFSARWNCYVYCSFPTSPTLEPFRLENEAYCNERTFRRVGYLETRYSEKRSAEDSIERGLWKVTRII